MKKKTIGRNDPCPCGSGLKYKKCHALHQATQGFGAGIKGPEASQRIPADLQKQITEHKIKEKRRRAQYGDIKPIISTDFRDYKVVAVGNQIHYAKHWKTFHDFLFDYIKKCLGAEWGNSELKKGFTERHPILHWYESLCKFQSKHIVEEGEIYSATCTGPVGAYLSLAYDLYLLRHHLALQSRLIERLKDKRQFQGARYEISVTASLIKAGFDIEFENESDKSRSHCEFVATHRASGKRYSIGAKSRHRPGLLGQKGSPRASDDIRLRVGGLLRDALKKEASNSRIIFVDVNMPPVKGGPFDEKWLKSLVDEVKRLEKDKIDNKPVPPATLFAKCQDIVYPLLRVKCVTTSFTRMFIDQESYIQM